MAAPSPILGDRVVKPVPETGFHLFIFTTYEKPGWHARIAGDRIRVAHPGSAIDYQGTVYELIQVGPAEGTPYAYRYALRKWEDRFVVRQIFPYSVETERAVAADLQVRRKQHRQHTWLVYLFPLTGLLPTPLLQRWQREWGLPMRGASLASVLLFGIAGFYLMFKSGIPSGVKMVALFVFLEQFIRLFWWLVSREAVGSLVLTAVWGFWNVLRGYQPDGTPKRKPLKEYLADRDEVRRLVEQPWDLEVRSWFRVPALLGEEPVSFEDTVYQPLGYTQEGKGLYRRYVFRLKKLEEGHQARREYSQERSASQVAALIPYERTRDQVHAWALVVGYLPAARQLELEARYDYNASEGTERSALAMLLAAGFQLGAQLLFSSSIRFGHALAAYLILESLYRLALVRSRGEPIGSAFGYALLPFLKFRERS